MKIKLFKINELKVGYFFGNLAEMLMPQVFFASIDKLYTELSTGNVDDVLKSFCHKGNMPQAVRLNRSLRENASLMRGISDVHEFFTGGAPKLCAMHQKPARLAEAVCFW